MLAERSPKAFLFGNADVTSKDEVEQTSVLSFSCGKNTVLGGSSDDRHHGSDQTLGSS